MTIILILYLFFILVLLLSSGVTIKNVIINYNYLKIRILKLFNKVK